LASAASLPAAQSYPVKPIRFVVPYPPGGIDPSLRIMIPKMTEVLGQQPIVDNRPGANGLIGAEIVSRSAPDGYAMLFVAASTMVSGALLSKEIKIDPLKDFTPITELYRTLQVLAVHSSLSVNSLKELVDYAKRSPGKLSYGSAGVGSSFQLDTEQFKLVTGTDIVHIPYKGTGPYTSDLLVGLIQMGILPMVNLRPHLASGKIKLLAVYEDKRHPAYPNIPTIAENFPAMVKVGGGAGIYGPPNLPRAITLRIHDAAVAAMRTQEVRDYHDQASAVIWATNPEQFSAAIKEEWDKRLQLIKTVGLKPE
ncbi:MAG: Bug family tripartite tricarboxylate transporter substrate binding protein, partial [Burkholderiales bacterium]